jgi:hypothetical protein
VTIEVVGVGGPTAGVPSQPQAGGGWGQRGGALNDGVIRGERGGG